MSKIETYYLCWEDTESNITVEVDHDKLTPELAQEINSFWSNAERRLRDGHSVLDAVVRLFAAAALQEILENGGAFFNGPCMVGDSCTRDVLSQEGWPPVGEAGLRIVGAEVDAPEFDTVSIVSKCRQVCEEKP